MKNYKKLKIWQKGMDLVFDVYQLASQLPPEEKFGLRSQVTRAAVQSLPILRREVQRRARRIIKTT